MKFLSINTSTSLCSVSLYNSGKFITLEKENTKDHTIYLASYTKELLDNKYDDLNFIAVSIGPGSYAGLRTGLAFSKGLSLSINKPLVPINNFSCMNSKVKSNNKYYICIYSHRDFIYAQLFDKNKKVSKSECIKFNKLKEYELYGYGLENILNSNFNEIILNSEIVGEYALKKHQDLIEQDLNKINPIYLEV